MNSGTDKMVNHTRYQNIRNQPTATSIIPKVSKGTHENLRNPLKSTNARTRKMVDHTRYRKLRNQPTATCIILRVQKGTQKKLEKL
mgnify:CR=1 FL=1